MGLNFRKELTLGEVQVGDPLAFYHIRHLKSLLKSRLFPQIFPCPSNQPAPTRLQVMYSIVICPHRHLFCNRHQHRYQDEHNVDQERLLSKLGKDAFPFHLDFPPHSPNSVTLVTIIILIIITTMITIIIVIPTIIIKNTFHPKAPGVEEAGEPCGVEYYVRGVVQVTRRSPTPLIHTQDATDKGGKRSSVNLSVSAPPRASHSPNQTVAKTCQRLGMFGIRQSPLQNIA